MVRDASASFLQNHRFGLKSLLDASQSTKAERTPAGMLVNDHREYLR